MAHIRQVHLPRELVDAICDDMDVLSLKASSLASHHWRVSAQPRLFRALVVREADRNHTFALFTAFVNSESGITLARHAKELTLLGRRKVPLNLEITIAMVDWVLSKLPALHTLHVQDTFIRSPSPLISSSPPRALEVLWLRRVDFGTNPLPWLPDEESGFIPFLNLFGSVTLLQLNDVEANGQRDMNGENAVPEIIADGKKISKHLRLQELVAMDKEVSSWDILTMFECSQCLEALDCLSVGEDFPTANALFWAVGRSLTSLHIDLEFLFALYLDEDAEYDAFDEMVRSRFLLMIATTSDLSDAVFPLAVCSAGEPVIQGTY